MSQHLYNSVLLTGDLRLQGLTSRKISDAVRSKELVRLRQGAYIKTQTLAQATPTERALIHHIAVSKTRSHAVLTRTSAALAWGAPLLELPSHIYLASSWRDRGKQQGIRRCVTPAEAINRAQEYQGLMVLSPIDTVLSCIGHQRALTTVTVAHYFLHQNLCNQYLLYDALLAVSDRGAKQARTLARSLTTELESPLESQAYFLMVLENLELPAVQRWVVTSSGRRYRPDFMWRRLKLILEVDGQVKYTGAYRAFEDQRRQDLFRQRELENEGWKVLRITYEDLTHRPQHVVCLLLRHGVRRLDAA